MKRRSPLELPEFASDAVNLRHDSALAEALSALVPAAAQAPPKALRERLLARARAPGLRFAPLFGPLGELFDLGDDALSALFERGSSADQWTDSGVRGVSLLHLTGGPRVAGADNGLVRLEPGSTFPRHRHLGTERGVVLSGGYRDSENGRIYLAGDLHEMKALSTHGFTALENEELLIAVSLVGGIEIDGLGRLAPASGKPQR